MNIIQQYNVSSTTDVSLHNGLNNRIPFDILQTNYPALRPQVWERRNLISTGHHTFFVVIRTILRHLLDLRIHGCSCCETSISVLSSGIEEHEFPRISSAFTIPDGELRFWRVMVWDGGGGSGTVSVSRSLPDAVEHVKEVLVPIEGGYHDTIGAGSYY